MRKRNPIKSKIKSKEVNLKKGDDHRINAFLRRDQSDAATSIYNTAYLPNDKNLMESTGMTRKLNPFNATDQWSQQEFIVLKPENPELISESENAKGLMTTTVRVRKTPEKLSR